MNIKDNRQQGFTIIELLVALSVFSFILLLIVTGFTQVTKVYQRGLAGRSTQQTARFVVDDISKAVRASSTVKAESNSGNVYLCLDDTRYIWQGSNNTLRKQSGLIGKECVGTNADVNQSLVDASSDLAVREFSANTFHPDTEGDPRSVELSILVTTRVEDELFISSPTETDRCDGSQKGIEYCATAEISTIVSLRSGAGKQ